MFSSCWSQPGPDTCKLGLQGPGRGSPPRAALLRSPNLCKAQNATPPPPPFPVAGTAPALRATAPGPSHCPGKQVPAGARGRHVGCWCPWPPRLLAVPFPGSLPGTPPRCWPRVPFPCGLQRSTPGSVTACDPHPPPLSLRIILYSSFQTIQYSLGYSYYYQVAGIVKVGVVRSLAFIPYFFFCITIHVYKLLIMSLAFINSTRRGSTTSAFANGNEALFLNKREKHHRPVCVHPSSPLPPAGPETHRGLDLRREKGAALGVLNVEARSPGVTNLRSHLGSPT